MSDHPLSPSLQPSPPTEAEWAVAIGHLSLTLDSLVWPPPSRAEMAAAPLVVIGHDYVAPPRRAAAAPAVGEDDGAEDPFARLLTGLATGPQDNIWPG